MIKRYVEAYNFEKVNFENIKNFKYSKEGFVIKLRLHEAVKEDLTLLDIKGCIKITQRVIKAEDEESLSNYEKSEGYFMKPDKSGNAPVLETELSFSNPEHPEWNKMKLGINTLMFDVCREDLYIVYDGVNFRLVFGGAVINNNMPFGTLAKPEENEVYINEALSCIEYSFEISKAEYFRKFDVSDRNLNYYTPFGHNNFIGDVANFYHNGTYHMLYLPDRHHHGNRWGNGGHHFEHMITKDFKNWEDVGPVWDISKSWQSTGTGTMFFHKGKYYVAFGLHTSRVIDEEKICSKELNEYYNSNGETKVVSFEELDRSGKYPGGASYSVSDDGINFSMGEKIFCTCENPSVYSNGEELIMYAGYGGLSGVWSSSEVDKPWKIISPMPFESGEESLMKNSTECPSYFEWNGYKYMIMGFNGFWRTERDSDEFIEYASKGFDVYEGLNVPMATKVGDGRAVIAGWIGGSAWGSAVVHRELLQYENGDLGMKWLPELFPEIEREDISAKEGEIPINEKKSYYIEAEIDPKKADVFRLLFVNGSEGEKSCELRLDLAKGEAGFGSCLEGETAEDILPMWKIAKKLGKDFSNKHKNLPGKSGDFSIANIRYPKEKFKLKVITHYYEKNNSMIIDVEIAETRTLLTCRKGFLLTKIKTDDNIKDIKLYNAKI